MKRNLLLTIAACGASLALSPALLAQAPAPDAAATTSGTAGGAGHHGWDAPQMLQHLTTQLNLTTDQQTQIKPILEASATQMKANHEDASLSREQKMAKAKEIRDALNSQINGILTPDQQKQWADMKEKMHNRRHGGADAQASASPSATATP